MLRTIKVVVIGSATGLLLCLSLFLLPFRIGAPIYGAMGYPAGFAADALGIVNEDTREFLLIWIIVIALDGILLLGFAWLLWHGFKKFRGTHNWRTKQP
jgi:hypothetical protein